ncbi:hypothetical protein BHE90_012475 [Fusarium euwallaceae]|uniref:Uncharacterized protein n=1 Tax=Fusarium euwallaceae TaxID=1147111 RepID=A0A430LBL9_9HYPO|nr:hypothetical protein BHE90_012475 [Fusarium euwallaceae]
MIATELYTIALERSTQPDLPTKHTEVPHRMARPSDIDRAACEGWLQEMNFLRPALAPNRKVVQFGSGGEDEDAGEQRRRFIQDRQRRMIIQSAFLNGLDGIEAMTERWPRAARAALNSMDESEEDEDRGVFESLVAVYDLSQRRRYQSI